MIYLILSPIIAIIGLFIILPLVFIYFTIKQVIRESEAQYILSSTGEDVFKKPLVSTLEKMCFIPLSFLLGIAGFEFLVHL